MEKEGKITKTELENFVFPSKYLPNCFSNDELLKFLSYLEEEYSNSIDMIKDNFECDGEVIQRLNGPKNGIYNTNKGSEPINFNISKPNGGNRTLSVCNPLFLIPLHEYILENSSKILLEQVTPNNIFYGSSHFYKEEGGVLVKWVYDDIEFESYQGSYYQNDYKTNMVNKLKISNGMFYCLNIDISNFYNSIYTHSISWECSKELKPVFNNLDLLTRTLNQNETKGIVIGPYTSSLFSELLLSKIDKKLIELFAEKKVYYDRYCDDYSIYSDSKEELEQIIYETEELLLHFKLELNMSKTKIEEFPYSDEKYQIGYAVKRIKSCMMEDISDVEKVECIINEIGTALKIRYNLANHLLQEIYQADINLTDEEAIKVLLDFLINLMFKNDLTSKFAVNLLVKIQSKTNFDLSLLIDDWIDKRKKLSKLVKEIADIWLMYLINKYSLNTYKIEEYMLDTLGKNIMIDILILEYYHNNMKSMKKHKDRIKDYLLMIESDIKSRYFNNVSECYCTKYWLLFYTNDIRWKLHEVQGFKGSILKKCSLNEITKTDKMKKRLNILRYMEDNKIQLFDM